MGKQLDIFLAVQHANSTNDKTTDLQKATKIGRAFRINNVADLINEYKIGKKEWERDQAFQDSGEW
jgi:hypothetical protein